VATLAQVWLGRFGLARLTAAVAVGSVIVGWALAQSPYLLPGELTLEQAAASDATLSALLVSVAVGLLFLIPALWWLFRLVLEGRLDQQFEPLDQRFRP
jgi:cytochrome d ubiquinol oxidase subunit II